MAGNRFKHGKGWPGYGSDRKRGAAANYRPRTRGPAQTPPLKKADEVAKIEIEEATHA